MIICDKCKNIGAELNLERIFIRAGQIRIFDGGVLCEPCRNELIDLIKKFYLEPEKEGGKA